jgi:co-chaperonin GroES (HSP10)
MDFPIKPTADRIVIEMFTDTNITAGGIELPEQLKSGYRFGEVKAVGRGTVGGPDGIIPNETKVGNIVQLRPGAADQVEVAGKKYFVVPERMILAIIDQNQQDKVILRNQVLSEQK